MHFRYRVSVPRRGAVQSFVLLGLIAGGIAADAQQAAPQAPQPDPSIDLSRIDHRVLTLYDAFRAPIQFTRDEIVPELRGSEDDARLHAESAADEPPRPEDIGSNNWVVSGARTLSGYPMMMNDPHRAQSAPSLRYWVHLVAPGWNVIGAGEPVLPGVSIGHNAGRTGQVSCPFPATAATSGTAVCRFWSCRTC